MLPRTSASRLAFSGVDELLLGEDAARPASGLRTSNFGHQRLEGPGPAAHRERADDAERRHRPGRTAPRAQSRSSVQRRAAARSSRRRAARARASKRSERASASLQPGRDVRRDRRPAAAPPPAIAAKWPRSRERATWPSSRAFSSLRGEAGRFLSWAEAQAMSKRIVSTPGGKLERDKGLESRPIRDRLAVREARASVTPRAA